MRVMRESLRSARERYEDEEIQKISRGSAEVEAEGYLKWCRVEEIMEFAKRCGFRKLGVAFCVGLREEAKKFVEILKSRGFEVYSVICKTGGVPKEEMNFRRIREDGFEGMCNPIAQAMILNELQTDLNIILGLCVGHDTLFIMHSKAPVTYLAVKDRVLAHNPLGAIYCSHSYYKSLKNMK